MANILIYGGLGLMLLGSVYGIFVAIKGGRETGWRDVRNISVFANFQHGKMSPVMRKLVCIWAAIMLVGFISVGIGMCLK